MRLFINKHEVPLKDHVGQKVTVTLGHGAWHSSLMAGNAFTFPETNDDLMVVAEKVMSDNGVFKPCYLIYDFKSSKLLGWMQQEYCQFGG